MTNEKKKSIKQFFRKYGIKLALDLIKNRSNEEQPEKDDMIKELKKLYRQTNKGKVKGGKMKIYNIKGYDIVLKYVRNVYPVEEEDFYWQWGFKYTDGFYEWFAYKTEQEALQEHDKFVKAVS